MSEDREFILLQNELAQTQRQLADARKQIADIWMLLQKFSTFADSNPSGGGVPTIGSPGEPGINAYSLPSGIIAGGLVDVWVSLGDSYDDTSNQELKGHKVKLRLRVDSVSAPIVYTIDTPGS